MKQKILFLSLGLLMTAYVSAGGTWVVGTNQVSNFLATLEQGATDTVPAIPEDTGLDKWDSIPGIVLTEYDIQTEYLDHSDENNHWRGFESIDFSNRGYKQKEGTLISFIQPSLVEADYAYVPDGYDNFADYFDRHDLSWLEELNFSGNDFHSVEIDGGPYEVMPLKKINLSNNPNLTDLVVVNLALLEVLDISGTGLSEDDIELITLDVHESSPDAVIITESSAVERVEANKYKVYMQGDNLVVRNMPENAVVSVFDLFGRNIIESTESTISMKAFSQGIYVVKINDSVATVKK
jgi:hypothetical protein